MKRKPTLFALMLGLFLAANIATAKPVKPPKPTKAPEIAVDTATSTIALLTGVLLLAGERYRSRRS